MNYIYFNEKGRLKDKHLDDMIATSHLADKIYLFCDLDQELETEYSASLAFKRADGFEIGEIECLREASLILNPFTNTEMPAFSLELGSDILAVPGPLKITARYYRTEVINGNSREKCQAMGMAVATVHDAVPNYAAMKSTVAANLNRKIENYISAPNKPLLLYHASGFLTITGSGEIPIENISNYKFIMLEWADTGIAITSTRMSVFGPGDVGEDTGFFAANTGDARLHFVKFSVSKTSTGLRISSIENYDIVNGGTIERRINGSIYVKAVYAL